MSAFAEWLKQVYTQGESVLREPLNFEPRVSRQVFAVVEEAFERHRLEVAGPEIPFDPTAAIDAANLLASACWRLTAAESEPAQSLPSFREPRTAAHLSADLTLRYLPSVLKRARARDAASRLTAELDGVLRHWPLSGVLADLDGQPLAPLDFDGHPGLQLLYAERLAATRRPGWLPPAGPLREWVERVFEERRLPLPATIPAHE